MQVIRVGRVVALGFLAALAAAPVMAQSVGQVGGPAENPPAGFTGQQYVDSRGCVFMRAGFSGQTTWVPRIDRDRKAVCNAVTPAEATARLNTGDNEAAPATESRGYSTPMATIASAMAGGQGTGVFAPAQVPSLDYAAPVVQAAPRRIAPAPAPVAVVPQAVVPVATYGQASVGGASVGCPAQAPVLQRMPLSNGGTVAVCTRGDGSATGWVSPTYRTGARPGAAISGGVLNPASYGVGGGFAAGGYATGGHVLKSAGVTGVGQSGSGGYVQTVIAGQTIIAPRRDVPRYKAAWNDDRLNPNRGLGTQRGWSAQAQVWTSTVPARTHADVAYQQTRKVGLFGAKTASRVSGSTMSAPEGAAPAATRRLYVQVGTFGQSGNAQNAAGRLAGMGLPVASAKSVQGGRHLVSIFAGPFGSSQDAQRALAAARQAGFGDAFIR